MPIRSVSATPPPIDAGVFLGPKAPSNAPVRVKNSHHQNGTVSLKDEVEAPVVKDKVELVSLYEGEIRQHVERRVIFFWHQLLACYGTKLHFELGSTMDQGESAPALDVKYADGSQETMTRNAAHSSTFPCLFACPLDEWNDFATGKVKVKPPLFTFVKGSDLYKTCNATMDMIREVNRADIKIDGTHHDSRFSKHAMTLLNSVSTGDMSPADALIHFVDKAISMVKEKLRDDETEEEILEVLEFYLDEFKEVKSKLENNPDWVFEHLDVYGMGDKTIKMKEMVLRIRSKAIRDNLLGQARIASMIEKTKIELLGRAKELIKDEDDPVEIGGKVVNKIPPLIDDAFKHLIVDTMNTDADKLRMRQFFAIPPKDYNQSLRGRVTWIRNGTELLALANEDLKDDNDYGPIKDLAQDISAEMYKMRVREIYQRGDVIRALRSAKGWSQADLARRLAVINPTGACSQSAISRREKGEVLVDREFAKNLSTLFDVPVGLLLPQFFNS